MIIISLGWNCYVKDLCKKIGYDKETDLYDWANTFEFRKSLACLDSKVDIFDDIHDISTLAPLTEFYNSTFSIRFPHDKEYFENRSLVSDKFTRRFERFTKYKTDAVNRYLFVRSLNHRGGYGFPAEDVETNYSEAVYNQLQKYLPPNSHVLLITCSCLKKIKHKIYSKFLVFDNVINIDTQYPKDKDMAVKQIYKNFFSFCEEHFDNLGDYVEEMNRIIHKSNGV
jgi:hypothetical protein